MSDYELFLKTLAKALKEPEMQEVIRAISSAEEEQEYFDNQEELYRLQTALAACELEKNSLRTELDRIRMERNGRKRKWEEQKLLLTREADRIRKENAGLQKELAGCRRICEGFAPLLDQYWKYCVLQEGLGGLERILPSESPMRFWTAGCQIDRIFRFWDEAQRRVESLTEEQRRALTDMIAFFIGQFNSLWERPVYVMMSDECGKPFDDRRHIRSANCSRYQGDVRQVLLEGIWNLNQKCAERRCVVLY